MGRYSKLGEEEEAAAEEKGGGGMMEKYLARIRWRRLAAVAWLALAVACSAAVHWQLRRETMDRAEERLVSMCEERARMLQEQFGVTVNHVHALSILISIFHFEKNPSAIDQVITPRMRSFLCAPDAAAMADSSLGS